jgi:hypothetical protein
VEGPQFETAKEVTVNYLDYSAANHIAHSVRKKVFGPGTEEILRRREELAREAYAALRPAEKTEAYLKAISDLGIELHTTDRVRLQYSSNHSYELKFEAPVPVIYDTYINVTDFKTRRELSATMKELLEFEEKARQFEHELRDAILTHVTWDKLTAAEPWLKDFYEAPKPAKKGRPKSLRKFKNMLRVAEAFTK